jgi:hypothetical protein
MEQSDDVGENLPVFSRHTEGASADLFGMLIAYYIV